jgi:hypothetical protein
MSQMELADRLMQHKDFIGKKVGIMREEASENQMKECSFYP